MPDAAIVIPTWNGADDLERCLASLRSVEGDFTTIVVDNGSRDRTSEVLAAHPEVVVVSLAENAGFAGGVNRGIEKSVELGFEQIALLNNDAQPRAPWLVEMQGALAADERLGGVCAKILRSDGGDVGLIDSTGDFLSTWAFAWPRGRDERDVGQWDAPECSSVHAISGGASLFRRRLFDEVGLFDEAFFAYYEDVDLGLRAARYGWRFAYVPTAVVDHRVEGTSAQLGAFRRHHILKNMALVVVKDIPARQLARHGHTLALGWTLLVADTARTLGPRVVARSMVALARAVPAALRERRALRAAPNPPDTAISLLRGLPPSVNVPWRP